jgi:hypothetical protein
MNGNCVCAVGGETGHATFIAGVSTSLSRPTSRLRINCSASTMIRRRTGAFLSVAKVVLWRRHTNLTCVRCGGSDDMSAVTTSILIVGAVLLIALAIIYFGLVRRRRD